MLDEKTIAFPNYDGNGMYLTAGNVRVNPHVGLLFISFEQRKRMRLNGVAAHSEDDPLIAEYPEAQFVTRVEATPGLPELPPLHPRVPTRPTVALRSSPGVHHTRSSVEDAGVGARRPPPRRPGLDAGVEWSSAESAPARTRRDRRRRSGALAFGTTRVKEWTVQTDELLYTKLARHIADTGSPFPVLHGEHVGFLGVVYPILLAPFYGRLDPVAAYDAAHVVNAVLFASAAIPVFLLVGGSCLGSVRLSSRGFDRDPLGGEHRDGDVGGGRLSGVRLGGARCHSRSPVVAAPRPARDRWARARLLHAAAVPRARSRAADRGPGRRRPAAGVRPAPRARRRMAVAVLVVIPLAALGETHRLLGLRRDRDGGITASSGVWKSAALHIDIVAVGLGVFPFLLGAAWAYSNLRGGPLASRAFALFTGIAMPLLVLETASYDVRFGGPDVIRGPLSALPRAVSPARKRGGTGRTTAGLGDRRRDGILRGHCRARRLPGRPGIFVDSAVTVLNGVIRDLSPGLPPGNFVAVCGIVLGAVCVALQWLPRPVAMLGVTLTCSRSRRARRATPSSAC